MKGHVMVATSEEAADGKTSSFGPSERWRIMKNIVCISFAFMLHFTAFHGTANLQSSVNADEGLGTFTLAAIYGSLLLSNIILPAVVINWLGCKWAMSIAFVAYMPFIAAQFYPRAYTLLPAGFMVGFGGGPLWCAKCTYLTVIAETYADITNQAADMLVTRFFGVFFMFYQMAQVWGNLISSTVLSLVTTESDVNTTLAQYSWELHKSLDEYDNRSLARVRQVENSCGASFCGGIIDQEGPAIAPPDMDKIRMIAGIFLACMIAASMIVAFGVDSLKRYSGRRSVPKDTAITRLLSTLRHTREPYQQLLLPATAYIGAEQAFMAADFNSSFVACGYGINNIGFVMICFGVFNAIAAVAAGSIVKVTGRYPVMIVALVLHVALHLTLLFWKPRPDEPLVYYGIAALWGTADAIWLVQVNALSGILFPGREEAAYASFRLWEATGSVIAYTISPYLCIGYKVYFLSALLIVGMAGYSAIEFMERAAKRGIRRHKSFELVNDAKEAAKS